MATKTVPATETQTALPRDEYSVALREVTNHPTAVTKQSVVELVDDYGNSTTWVIKTVRIEGAETVFLQKNDINGGGRWVLPPAVTSVLARQRDGAAGVVRKRGARAAAATRKALGMVSTFQKKEA